MAEAMFTVDAIVREYHVYQDLWDASVGEQLPCEREQANYHDSFAVSNCKINDNSVLCPNEDICSMFLRRGASADLPQRGLEILYILILIFKGPI